MKKFLSLLAIALMAATASAAVGDKFTLGLYKFQIVEEFTPGGDGCVKLIGLIDAGKNFKSFSAGGDAGRVPGEVTNFDGNHYVVSIIGGDAFLNSQAKTICFDYGPKRIEGCAFHICNNLDSISIPSSVDTIEFYIAQYCPKLKYICVNRPTPPGCDPEAFGLDDYQENLELCLSNSCSTPESINMYRNHAVWGKFGNISPYHNQTSGDACSIRDGVFHYYYVNALRGNFPYYYTLIGIEHDANLKNYTSKRPRLTTEISAYAFLSKNLESIDLSGEYGITKIGDMAFASCNYLKQVKLPSSVVNIGSSAFYDCISLTEFTVPKDCKEIANSWVNGCTSLTDIFVEDGNSYFQAYVGKSMTGVAGKHSLLYTNNGKTLYRCPSGVSDAVELNHGVETIESFAFMQCRKITSINLPYGVKRINNGAFNSCYDLARIYMPSSINFIGHNVFLNCVSLKTVGINCSVAPTAFDTSFPQNSDMELLVPDIDGIDAKSYKTKTGFKNFANYTTHPAFAYDFVGQDGAYVVTTQPSDNTYGKAVMTVYLDNFGEERYVTPRLVSNSLVGLSDSSPYYKFELAGIGNRAFSRLKYTNLKEVDMRISMYLTHIGTSAFDGSIVNNNISKIKLPSNLEVIGTNAFAHCYNLGEITIPNKVTKIGTNAFAHCYNLEEITIPDKVTEIGDSAFYNCSNVKTL
ncbi:MAG: leucine-rich repeat protein, partial [Muribaculaceae bacterium]|nr:leucine-rich repeat protein [Muribaculaceae bacterium]